MTMDSQPENLHVAEIASMQEPLMERPSADAPEAIKCRWWREQFVKLSREDLAMMTGFSVSAVRDFEHPGKDIDPMARKRYRLACAAAVIGIEFDWMETTLRISRPVEIKMMGGE
jgi:hypothetical protein